MIEFLQQLPRHEFLQNAALAGVLSSVSCGVVGSYVVVRRITYIAGAIAHCILGGMGAAQYFQLTRGWTWCEPLAGAVVAALLAAVIIGLVSLRAKEREDTVIGALWAIGMAVGVIFLARTPGYARDPSSLLFGNILWVSRGDLWLILALNVLVVGVVALFYKQFLAVCFDEEFARLRGVRVEAYYLLLLALTALTVVILVKIVGVVLVIALLTLPVAIAGYFVDTLLRMMLLATILCAAITFAGQALCYSLDFPAGATIVLLSGAVYLVCAASSALRRAGRR